MITEVIKVVADTGDANRKIDKLDNSLNTLKKSTSGVAKGMKESSVSVLENGSAMGLLNAVTGGYAQVALDSVEALGLFSKESKLATALQSAYSFVVGTSTGAMKLFKLALAGTGIGLIILALVSLVLNFGKITDAVTKFLPGLKLVGDFFRTVSNAVTDFIGITSEAERELDRFNEQAKKSLKQNEDYMQTRGDLLDDFSKKKVEAKNRYLKATQEEGISDEKRNELAKRLNRDLIAIDKERNDKKVKDNKDAQDKIDSDNKSINEKRKALQEKADAIAKAKRKAIEDARKSALEKANKIEDDAREDNLQKTRTALQNLTAKFEQERKILVDNNVSTVELEAQFARNKKEIQDKLKVEKEKEDLDYFIKESENAIKRDADAKAKRDKAAAEELEFQRNKDTAIATSRQNLSGIINNLELLGINKSKAGQAISKSIALTQIGIDSAVAISKASTLANAEGVAAQLAFPLVPGIGTVARVISYTGTALSVISNISRAKKLLSGGGGDSGGGQSGGGQSAPPAPSAPSFNLVQGTGANQIASSLGGQNQPIQAYVVSSNVTTAQALERNIISNSKF
jgi:hypothetical protein